MLIVYASKTGNINRFIKKTALNKVERIVLGTEEIKEPFILLTYTTGSGCIPIEVAEFLKQNSTYLKAVIGSGNRSWGITFCRAAKLLSEQYKVPLLMTFELSGRETDVEKFLTTVNNFN